MNSCTLQISIQGTTGMFVAAQELGAFNLRSSKLESATCNSELKVTKDYLSLFKSASLIFFGATQVRSTNKCGCGVHKREGDCCTKRKGGKAGGADSFFSFWNFIQNENNDIMNCDDQSFLQFLSLRLTFCPLKALNFII